MMSVFSKGVFLTNLLIGGVLSMMKWQPYGLTYSWKIK